MSTLETLAKGLTEVSTQKQETRDRLAKLFYRNAAMNRGIPWGEEDEEATTTTTTQTQVTCQPTPPPAPAEPVVAQPAPPAKSSLASKLAPWIVGAGLLGAGGTAGYILSRPSVEPPAEPTVEASSLYQSLEDRGYNVPPGER